MTPNERTHAERTSDASIAELHELIDWSRGRHPPLIQPGYEAAVMAKVRELDAAKPAKDARIALATEWLRDHVTPCSAQERAYMDTIIEALAAYDPECGARTVAKPAQGALLMNAHTRAEALRLLSAMNDALSSAEWEDDAQGEGESETYFAAYDKLRALLSADDVPDGRRMAVARDEFFASLSGATLTGAPTGVYLRNRLELAFIEGWNAAKRDAAAPPPNGETK